jgi:hypothetical protein
MSDKGKQFDKLIDYIKGQLNSKEHASMKAQIENDPILQKMISVIKGMKNEVDQIEWPKLEKSSHDLFDRLLNDVKKQKSKGNEKRGVNIFDSRLLPLPEGVRPADVDTRRLKFLIGDAQLELSIYPISPKSFELIGQISGLEQVRSLSVELISGKSRITSEANQFNLFRVPRVPAGTYNLNFYDGQNIIGKIDLEL